MYYFFNVILLTFNFYYCNKICFCFFQGHSGLFIRAEDGDVGDPRPVTLSLEGDDLNYFTLISNGTNGQGTVVTNNNPIDRENHKVLQNGGVYTFNVKVKLRLNIYNMFVHFKIYYSIELMRMQCFP